MHEFWMGKNSEITFRQKLNLTFFSNQHSRLVQLSCERDKVSIDSTEVGKLKLKAYEKVIKIWKFTIIT